MNKKNGFSLIEVLLVLGIVNIFIVSVFIVYPKILASSIFENIYKDINYNLNDEGDFRNFRIKTNKFENILTKIEKTDISPSSLPNSGLVTTIQNAPISLCYNSFKKPDALKIYYIKINNQIINKPENLSNICDSISNNFSNITIQQYLY